MAESISQTVTGTLMLDGDGNPTRDKSEAADKQKVEATVSFVPGDSLEEATQLYGEETVFQLYTQAVTVKFGNAVRGLLVTGKSEAEIVAELEDWKPNVSRRRVKVSKSLDEQFEEMSEEEQIAFIARIRARVSELESA